MTDLTIVSVVLNDADGLSRTIQSVQYVLSAEPDRLEHVIVDGLSCDGTAELALEYAASEAGGSVVVLSEPDDGLYDAMNKGLAIGQGRYTWFVNAGDEIASPETVSLVIDQLRDRRPLWLIGRTEFLDGERNIVGISENIPFCRWRHLLGRQMHAHPSTIMETSVLQGLGGFDYQLADFAADWDMVIRVARKDPHPLEIDQVLAYFAPGGVSERRIRDVHRTLGRIRAGRLSGGPVVRIANFCWTRLLDWRLGKKLKGGHMS